MKNCPQCNSENMDDANHCMECGYAFYQQVPTQNNNEIMENNNQISQQRMDNNYNNVQDNVQNNNRTYQNPNQQYNNYAQVQPQNKKSKIVGLVLNIILVGLGYAYVGKWGEGIVLLVVYLLMWVLGFMLIFPFIIALGIWIYSLFKTNEMIDKYNAGIPY